MTGDVELVDFIDYFIDFFDIGEIFYEAGFRNKRGYPPEEILAYLMRLIFYGVSPYYNEKEQVIPVEVKHSTIGNFLNHDEIEWTRFTILLSRRVFSFVCKLSPSLKQIGGVVCVDDSDFERDKSKKAEFISKKWSHTSMSSYNGYKLVASCFFEDGFFLPLCGVLVSTTDRDKMIYRPQTSSKGVGGSLREKLVGSKITEAMSYEVLAAKFYGFPVSFVTFDSFFAEPATIYSVFRLDINVIGMLKAKKDTKYLFRGDWLTVEQIFEELKRENPNAFEETESGDVLFQTIAEAKVKEKIPYTTKKGTTRNRHVERTFPVRLVFLKNFNESRVYACLVCTDTDISPETVRRIYSVRWSIELIFWFLKSQNVGMNANQRSLSLDSMSAHVAIALSLYTMLVAEMNFPSGKETVWAQFQACKSLMLDIDWIKASIDSARSLLNLGSQSVNRVTLWNAAQTLLKNPEFSERISRIPKWAFKKSEGRE